MVEHTVWHLEHCPLLLRTQPSQGSLSSGLHCHQHDPYTGSRKVRHTVVPPTVKLVGYQLQGGPSKHSPCSITVLGGGDRLLILVAATLIPRLSVPDFSHKATRQSGTESMGTRLGIRAGPFFQEMAGKKWLPG